MHIARRFYSSFIELISAIPLLPCVLIWLKTCILSTWEDPWALGCQLVLFTISRVPSNVPSMQQILNERLGNVWAPSVSRHCVSGAFSSHWYVVLLTPLQERYYYSCRSNKIAGTQAGEVTCSKPHSWCSMDFHLSVGLQRSRFSILQSLKKESIERNKWIHRFNIIDGAQAWLHPG